MRTKKTVTPIILTILIIAISLSGCKKSSKEKPKEEVKYFKLKPTEVIPTAAVSFSEGVNNTEVVETGSDNIAIWAKNGLRDKTLILIDSKISIQGQMYDDYLMEVKKLIDNNNYELLSKYSGMTQKLKKLYDSTNYIYVAHRLGIIKDVVWVLPISSPINSDYKDFFKQNLKKGYPQFAQEDIDSFTLSDKKIQGSLFGIPITVIAITELPEFKEPVIMSINLSYINSFVVDNVKTPIEDITVSLLNMLKNKKPLVNYITIVNSNATFEVPLMFRFLSNILRDIFKDPSLMWAPKREWILKQEADKFLAFVNYESAEQRYNEILKTTPNDPSIYFQLSTLRTKDSRYEEASEHLEKAITYDNGYVLGYISLTSKMQSEDEKLLFLQFGAKNHPESVPILTTLAKLLSEKGMFQESLDIYMQLVKLGTESYDLNFYIADCYYKLKNYQKAIDMYNKTYSILPEDVKNAYSFSFINLAEAYEKIDDTENALKYYKMFLDYNKISSETESVKLKIKRLKDK